MQAVTNHDALFSFVSHAAKSDNGAGSQSLHAVWHERKFSQKVINFDHKQTETLCFK